MKFLLLQHRMTVGTLLPLLIIGALFPVGLAAQTSNVSYFTISDIGNPRPWKPGHVKVGENIDNVTVTARDVSGKRVADFNGLVYLSQHTDYGLGRTSPGIVQLVNGEWTGTLQIYRAGKRRSDLGVIGDVWIRATDNAANPHFGNSNLFVALPEQFTRLLVIVPGEEYLPGSITGRSGLPYKQQAGLEFVADIYATDAFGNEIENISDAVHLISTDENAVLQSNTRMLDGRASMSVTLNTPGQHTVTAFDADNPSTISPHTSSNITVDSGFPNSVQRFVFDPIGSPQTVGNSLQLRIRAVDAAGSTVTSHNEPTTLSVSTGPGTMQVGSVVFINGTWTGSVVLTKADQNVRLTVRDFSGGLTSDSNTFALVPGPVARFSSSQVSSPTSPIQSQPRWSIVMRHGARSPQT